MPVSLAVAKEALAVEIGEDLAGSVKSLHARALRILGLAEGAGQLDTALKAIRELRGILELLGKLEGQIADRTSTPTEIRVTYVDKQVIVAPSDVHQGRCIDAQ